MQCLHPPTLRRFKTNVKLAKLQRVDTQLVHAKTNDAFCTSSNSVDGTIKVRWIWKILSRQSKVSRADQIHRNNIRDRMIYQGGAALWFYGGSLVWEWRNVRTILENNVMFYNLYIELWGWSYNYTAIASSRCVRSNHSVMRALCYW